MMLDTIATDTRTATGGNALALSVRALRKTYDDVVAVDGLDLEVGTGECFGLLGPNGAGKTTTIEICEGLLTADAGGRRTRQRLAKGFARAARASRDSAPGNPAQ